MLLRRPKTGGLGAASDFYVAAGVCASAVRLYCMRFLFVRHFVSGGRTGRTAMIYKELVYDGKFQNQRIRSALGIADYII